MTPQNTPPIYKLYLKSRPLGIYRKSYSLEKLIAQIQYSFKEPVIGIKIVKNGKEIGMDTKGLPIWS